MPEFIVEQTLILDTPDQAKAAERAQQIATFLAHDWPELTLVHTGDVEPCPPFIENPEPHPSSRPAQVIRAAVDEAWGVCYCPDDCRCRREADPPCGCTRHEAHVINIPGVGCAGWRQTNDAGLQYFQCCGDPADCGSCP